MSMINHFFCARDFAEHLAYIFLLSPLLLLVRACERQRERERERHVESLER